ncbi:MAG: HD domain-containing protein [Thermaerobacter sp.]|jgi:metal-dependent HD superfamily phosphatase/phosphodiesterase|nr:HD domain-containing protein [Thermaerobacter sp.]
MADALQAVTLEDVKNNPEVELYIRKANEHMAALGYTEHGFRHAGLVSHIANNILARLERPQRLAELAAIAGYLHDIGNMLGRHEHGQASALLSWSILRGMGMEPEELAVVAAAVGNHEEEYGQPLSDVSAAVILADKSDVHASRVQNPKPAEFDIHDRVNFAVKHSFLRVDAPGERIVLELSVDTQISPVMDYFEIFLSRMVMCRRAAAFLNCKFHLQINEVSLL